ncbi:protein kinase domain-containing protein [Leptolyngbya sp. AN02str]|uniref:protein kinase domain-containing protein n=1 Tax=Leptolyngbya sp. AN02str TaxID=3423363 RepID=UPI003D31374C
MAKKRLLAFLWLFILSHVPVQPLKFAGGDMLLGQSSSSLNCRYRIIKLLGQGSLGKTFLAVDQQQDPASFCVVKQLSLEYETIPYPHSAHVFQQETQYLSQLGEHPQIPAFIDTFVQNHQAFIVQEWIDGRTLERETCSALFKECEVRSILQELLPVLQYLHDRHIVHRDIKPANIIRCKTPPHKLHSSQDGKQGELVLVDFGSAIRLTSIHQASTETLIGSAEYAAPEQIRGQVDYTSDLYSLGVTCLHLLTQMSPFELYDGGDSCWRWQEYLSEPISLSLEMVLRKMIEPVARQRYQSATEVLADLETSSTQPEQSDFPWRQPQQIDTSKKRYQENHQTWYFLKPETETSSFAYNVAAFLTPRLAGTATQPNQKELFSTKRCKSSSRSRSSFMNKMQNYAAPVANHETRNAINFVFFFLSCFILSCLGFASLIVFISTFEQASNPSPVETQNWRSPNADPASNNFDTFNSSNLK